MHNSGDTMKESFLGGYKGHNVYTVGVGTTVGTKTLNAEKTGTISLTSLKKKQKQVLTYTLKGSGIMGGVFLTETGAFVNHKINRRFYNDKEIRRTDLIEETDIIKDYIKNYPSNPDYVRLIELFTKHFAQYPPKDYNFRMINATNLQSSINEKNKKGQTKLMVALMKKNEYFIDKLLKYDGIELLTGEKDNKNKDELDYACEYGKISTIARMILKWIEINKITNWQQFESFDIFTVDKMQSLIKIAENGGNGPLVIFLKKLDQIGIKAKNFAMIQYLLTNYSLENADDGGNKLQNIIETNFNQFRKDQFNANYLFSKCKESTLNDLNDVINNGLLTLECGFNDSLLWLSNKIDQRRLSKTLETVTDQCLNSQKKTVNNYQFFKNNLLSSNIWGINDVNYNIDDKTFDTLMNEIDSNVNDGKSKTGEEKKADDNGSDEKDDNEIENENQVPDPLLFDRVHNSVILDELKHQKQYIKDEIIKIEKENDALWKSLKYDIINDESLASRNIRQNQFLDEKFNDLMKNKGIQAEYRESELKFDNNANGFNGAKEYDEGAYLTRLLITAYKIDPIFQLQTRKIFDTIAEKNNIKCTFAPAPVKTKDRCVVKASLDYANDNYNWPFTANILDLVRCSLVFDNIKVCE